MGSVRPLDPKFLRLLNTACEKPMSTSSRERQVVSLAFGNVRLENDRVTKVAVAEAVRNKPKR